MLFTGRPVDQILENDYHENGMDGQLDYNEKEAADSPTNDYVGRANTKNPQTRLRPAYLTIDNKKRPLNEMLRADSSRPVSFRSKVKNKVLDLPPQLDIPQAPCKPESTEDLVKKFKLRRDLRDCQLPGMVSKVTKEACRGWRKTQVQRYSKQMAKVKLGPCLGCRYFNEPTLVK